MRRTATLLLLLALWTAGCAAREAGNGTAEGTSEPLFVDRFEFELMGNGAAEACNAVPDLAPRVVPVDGRPGDRIRFEFAGDPPGAAVNGDLRIVLSDDEGAELAQGTTTQFLTLDVPRADIPNGTRLVHITPYVCNAPFAQMRVRVVASFFDGEVPEGYSGL